MFLKEYDRITDLFRDLSIDTWDPNFYTTFINREVLLPIHLLVGLVEGCTGW